MLLRDVSHLKSLRIQRRGRSRIVPKNLRGFSRRCRPTILWILLVTSSFTASSSAAQDSAAQEPKAPSPFWIHDSFMEDAGLEGQTVFSITFREDTTWLGTSNGLYRFNGFEWKRFGIADDLPSLLVRSVCIDGEGSLWVGTDRGTGVFDPRLGFDDKRTKEALSDRSVRRIRADADGTLWFSCDRWPRGDVEHGLFRLRDGQWVRYGPENGLPNAGIHDTFRGSDGTLYVITEAGVAHTRDESHFEILKGIRSPRGRRVSCLDIDEDSEGRVYVMTKSAVFLSEDASHAQVPIEERSWTRFPHRDMHLAAQTMTRTSEGEIIAARKKGPFQLFALSHDRIANRPLEKKSLPKRDSIDVELETLIEAPDGALWAGGRNLLVRFPRKSGEWTAFSNLPSPRLRDRQGAVWFGDDTRVVRYFQGAFQEFAGATKPILETEDGAVWTRSNVDQENRGLRRYRNGQLELEYRASDLPFARPRRLITDANETLWVVAGRRSVPPIAAFLYEDVWHTIDFPEEDRTRRFVTAAADAESGMWYILQDASLAYYAIHLDFGRPSSDSAQETSVPKCETLILDRIPLPPSTQTTEKPGLTLCADGALWIYGVFGIRRFDDIERRWREPFEFPGRRVRVVRRAGPTLWMSYGSHAGGENGIGWVRKDGYGNIPDLDVQTCGSASRRIFFHGRGILYGIPANQNQIDRRFSLPVGGDVESVRASDSGLWVGTSERTLHYQSDGRPPRIQPLEPPEGSIEFGEDWRLFLQGVQYYKPRGEESYDVSYRLDQRPWTPYQPLRNGEVVLDDLSVGSHVVEIRLRDEAGDVSRFAWRHAFEVRSVPLQDRPWFNYALIGSLLVVLVSLGVGLRAKHRLARHASQLEAEIGRRTEELGRSERKFRGFFEQCSDGILIVDTSNRISDCNRQAEILLDSRRSEIVDKPLRSVLGNVSPDPPDFSGEEGDQDWTVPLRLLRDSQGTERELEVHVSPLHNDDGDPIGFQLVLRDVTDARELERRGREVEKMEAVGRLAGNIAHDFNNLLTVIVGHGELTLMSEDDPKVREDMQAILDAASHARCLTTQLQSFSRGQILNPRIIDLNAALNEMAPSIRHTLGDNIRLELALGFRRAFVRIDPDEFRRALVHIVQNAKDAMPEGGALSIATRVVGTFLQDRLGDADPCVELKIRDTGLGMDEAVLRKAFDPFFTTKEKGIGLGLSTVYGIVMQSNGTLKVQSSSKRGTTFTIGLPYTLESAPLRTESRPVVRPTPSGRQTILLVEDEDSIRTLLLRMLEEQGYRVYSASNGQEALDIAENADRAVDLLLTDIVMPGMTGDDLAKTLRQSRTDLRVIFMTGYANAPDLTTLDEEAGFLRKPFSPSRVLETVRSVLHRKIS